MGGGGKHQDTGLKVGRTLRITVVSRRREYLQFKKIRGQSMFKVRQS